MTEPEKFMLETLKKIEWDREQRRRRTRVIRQSVLAFQFILGSFLLLVIALYIFKHLKSV